MPTAATNPNLKDQARQLLEARGYWKPLPGTKAASNPKLFFAYYDVVAFAVDAATLHSDNPVIHVINSRQDVALYTDPDACAKAVAARRCSPRIAGRQWLVIPAPPKE
ncbi:MAG: hypothetical protein L0099_08490 [Acidobacteria bacterium]|nr:hypothetical protein [Acidobacteriota bacterium]